MTESTTRKQLAKEMMFVLSHGRTYRRRNGDRIQYLDRMDIPKGMQDSHGHLSGSSVVISRRDAGAVIDLFKRGQHVGSLQVA